MLSQLSEKAGHTLIPGGLNGYSDGNKRTPWYSPPAKGESGGPRYGIYLSERLGSARKTFRTIRKFPRSIVQVGVFQKMWGIPTHRSRCSSHRAQPTQMEAAPSA